MNIYKKPELEVIEIGDTDVITASGLVEAVSEIFSGTFEWGKHPSITE